MNTAKVSFPVWLLIYSTKAVICKLIKIPLTLISVKISLNLVSKGLCSQIDGLAEITSGCEFSNSVLMPPLMTIRLNLLNCDYNLNSGDVLSWHRKTLLDSLKLSKKMKH